MTLPTTPARDAERTRQSILDAATQLFSQQGYAATGLQQVADAAGVARATPSYFFGSKEGLWKAVLEAQNLLVSGVVPQALALSGRNASREDILSALVEVALDFHLQYPHFLRLRQWSELQENHLNHDVADHPQVIKAAMQGLQLVVKGTALEGEDVRHLVMSVMTACYAPFIFGNTLGAGLGFDVTTPEFQTQWRAHLKRLLLAALQERKQS